MAKRELQFDDGKSQKFWTISLKGTSHLVTFGRIGTKGQTRTKDFVTYEEAKKLHDKLVAQKLGKGYVDVKKSVKKTLTKKPAVKKATKNTTAKTGKKAVKSTPTRTVAKKAKKKMPKRKSGKIRCIYVTSRSDKTMDRGMYWDPSINRLPTKCPKCGLPDLDALPKYYRLIRNMTMTNAEIAMVACGNFVVRERVHRILKCVAPKVCSFRTTYFQNTREKTPWTLVVPKEKLKTARVKKSIKRCSKCKQPVETNPCWDYYEWFHLDVTDPSFGKKDQPREEAKSGPLSPLYRFEACRESEYEIFKSLQWDGSASGFGWQHDWQDINRDLFLSVRLWELLKRTKVKGPVKAA